MSEGREFDESWFGWLARHGRFGAHEAHAGRARFFNDRSRVLQHL